MKTHTKAVSEISSHSLQSPTFDFSLLEWALSLSYEERIEAHEAARGLMEDLRKAGRDFYANRSKGFAETPT